MMLLLHAKFEGLPVATIQSGHVVATISHAIINPHNLSIEAFYVDTGRNGSEMVLFTSDIREVSQQGVVIDHDDQIMATDDLVRLEKITSLNFQLLNKTVATESGHKIGKVGNYVVDSLTFKIMRIEVRQSVFKNWSSVGLTIARSQIVKVTDKKVIVRDAVVKAKTAPKKKIVPAPLPMPETRARKPAASQSSSESA